MGDDWRRSTARSWGAASRGSHSAGREREEESVVQLSEKELQSILQKHGVSTARRSAADQRDEIISMLSRKVQESGDLFELLEARMLDRERDLEHTRRDLLDCEEDLRRAEDEIDRLRAMPPPAERVRVERADTTELEYEVAARDRTIRALEEELAERESTNKLMKDMLDQKTSNINLLKVHHQTELNSQGGIFNSVLDKREDELDGLRKAVEQREEGMSVLKAEHERLIEDICIIFSLEPVRTDTAVLDSLRTVQQYLEDRDADLATLVQQHDILSEQHDATLVELNEARAKPAPAPERSSSAAEVHHLQGMLKQADDARKELGIESGRELQELRAENHKLEAQLATARQVGNTDGTGVAEAVCELVSAMSRHGLHIHEAPLAVQTSEAQDLLEAALSELDELHRSRSKSRRQKEEIISAVLEDPFVQAMAWDSESEPDDDDLSDHISSGERWARTRVRVRSVVDRLARREKEVSKLRNHCQTLRDECSTIGQSVGPYLGLVAESSRACDDTGPGVRLIDVRKYTAADRAGLKQGDRLIELGGRSVTCAYDLDRVLSELCPGDTVDVTYVRGKATCSSMLVVDPANDGRRRKKKMARAEIQARVGSSTVSEGSARRKKRGDY